MSAAHKQMSQVKVLAAQLCPTLCDPVYCNPPGSFIHGILQARILEWVAIPFLRGSSWPRDWTWVSWIAGGFFTFRATAAAKSLQSCLTLCNPIDGSPPGSPIPGILQGKNTGVGCHFLLQCMKVKSESEVAQSCPTLCDPMDCSPPGSSVHGISQARVLERGAIAFSIWATREPQMSSKPTHTEKDNMVKVNNCWI